MVVPANHPRLALINRETTVVTWGYAMGPTHQASPVNVSGKYQAVIEQISLLERGPVHASGRYFTLRTGNKETDESYFFTCMWMMKTSTCPFPFVEKRKD